MSLSWITYWVKGGFLAVIIAVIFFATLIFFLPQISTNFLMIFAFPLWAGAMSAMGRETFPLVEVGIGILFTTGIYFLLGAILGAIYGSIKYRVTFLIVSLCIFVGIPIIIATNLLHDFNRATIQGITSPEDCETYEDQSSKSRCYSGYYRMFPPVPALCEKMIPASDFAFERKECSRGVGAMRNDIDLCHQFHDPLEQEDCLNGFGKFGPYDPYDYQGKPKSPYVRWK